MVNIKKIIAIILLVSPLTFLGQGKNVYKIKESSKPVIREKVYSETILRPRNYLYVVGGVGTNMLHGDNGILSIPGLGCQIGIGYQALEYIGLEGKLGLSMLSGSFKGAETQFTNALEANISLMINLTNIVTGYQGTRKQEWILHAGYGQTQSRGRIIYSNGDNKAFGYENYQEYNNTLANGKVDGMWEPTGGGINGRVVARTFPVGIMFSYKLTERIKLNFDLTTIYVDTDRFDGVPAGYVYDMYSQFDVRIQYRLKLRDKVDSPCNNMFSEYKRRK